MLKPVFSSFSSFTGNSIDNHQQHSVLSEPHLPALQRTREHESKRTSPSRHPRGTLTVSLTPSSQAHMCTRTTTCAHVFTRMALCEYACPYQRIYVCARARMRSPACARAYAQSRVQLAGRVFEHFAKKCVIGHNIKGGRCVHCGARAFPQCGCALTNVWCCRTAALASGTKHAADSLQRASTLTVRRRYSHSGFSTAARRYHAGLASPCLVLPQLCESVAR